MPERAKSIVLCYHAVSASWQDRLAVSPDTFEQQIRSLLDRGLVPVTGEEVLRGDPGSFHVTFDDCYTSIRRALDILRTLGVPATIFACSTLADGGRRIAVPELAARARGCEHELSTMSWAELREEAGEGIEVGSHTVSHPHLPRLTEREIADELSASRRQIEDALGLPCRFVAYPYGENDARVRAAAQRAGYLAAFGLDEKAKPADTFAFPRVDIYRGDGTIRFRAKTSRLGATLVAVSNAARWTAPGRS